MKRVLGIVNLHHNVSLGELTKKRSVASVNLLGRYTFADFIISNYTNSGINDIMILVKENIRSLLHHLGFGQLNYTINLKTGGLSILFNEKYAKNPIYNTDINNMLENIRYLEDAQVDNIIIAPAHMLMNIDFQPFVEKHMNSGNNISVLYKKIENAKEEFLNSFFVKLNGNRVTNISINKGLKDDAKIFMETIIIKKSKLLEILKNANKISVLYSFRDFVISALNEEIVNGFEYKGYLKCFDSLNHYAQFSLELLKDNSQLFKSIIYTRSYDTPPTRYFKGSNVSNSFIANGTIIKGTVKNSIIGRGVVIEEGAIVTNSIILASSKIGKNIIVDRVVIDKNVNIKHVKEVKGEDSYVAIGEGENL